MYIVYIHYTKYQLVLSTFYIVASCLLGSSEILMKDYSTKRIEDIRAGDVILDARLQPATVLTVITNFLGNRQLYQFFPNGPVFTPEHQFLSDLKTKRVGVVSKNALFSESPQLEETEGENILEFQHLYNILQLKNGNISQGKFELVHYDKMNSSTVVYALGKNGELKI